MQNYKNVETHEGYLQTFETAEPVTWKAGEPLLWYHVFNIGVLEQELALIKQIDQRWLAEEIWERLEHLDCCARDIYECSGAYVQRQQAALLIRECDRLEAECAHQWDIEFGTIARGTPFDEEDWSRDFERREKELVMMNEVFPKGPASCQNIPSNFSGDSKPLSKSNTTPEADLKFACLR